MFINRSRVILFAVFLVMLSSLEAQTDSSLNQLHKKYQDRGLPVFRNQEIDREIKEWLEDTEGTTGILASRYDHYRNLIESERRAHKLPWFVGFIPAANTGFEPRFRSPSGYTGMWPMPYLMAKKYGLQLTALYDERREPEKVTKAACQYIQELQNIYQDWRLTITAFRVGPARLNQVIHRVNTINFDTVYAALEPQEQLPIIQFFAASVALSEYLENRESELQKSPWGNRERVLSIERALPFSFFEEYFDLSTLEMRNYNPALRTDQVPYMGEAFEFYLPKKEASKFNFNRDSLIFGWKVVQNQRLNQTPFYRFTMAIRSMW